MFSFHAGIMYWDLILMQKNLLLEVAQVNFFQVVSIKLAKTSGEHAETSSAHNGTFSLIEVCFHYTLGALYAASILLY